MKKETKYKFKFSFVMPVYNVEKYLDETVQSILNQDLDFQQNCEIIFINDGSPDNAEEICLKYKEQFPDNIKYVKQKNQGVSAARNAGLKLVEGEFVSFLDSDDLISKNTLSSVSNFFEEHKEEIDLVAIKMQFFEAQNGPHILNFKFNKSRVIDINRDHECVQLSSSSTFIRSSAVVGVYEFDKRLTVAEDAVLVSQILLDKMKYGVLSSPTYHYRRRISENSAINTSAASREWYLNTPKYAYDFLIKYSLKEKGYTPDYIQSLVMYDMQWRYGPQQTFSKSLSLQDRRQYKDLLNSITSQISDSIIIGQKHLSLAAKMYILNTKYKGKIDKKLLRSLFSRYQPQAVVEFIEYDSGELEIEGRANIQLNIGYKLFFKIGRSTIPTEGVERHRPLHAFSGEEPMGGGGFKARVHSSSIGLLSGYLEDDRGVRFPVDIKYNRFSQIANVPHSYRTLSGLILSNNKNNSLLIESYSLLSHIKHELLWLFRIVIALKLRQARDLFIEQRLLAQDLGWKEKIRPFFIPLKAILYNFSSVVLRIAYYVAKLFYKKPIWIISDRSTAAGDNGEAFFRYLEGSNNNLNTFFAISKKSDDYKRMQRYGRVVHHGGLRYKVLFLLSSKIISSHADDYVINPFGRRLNHFFGLFSFKFTFLQHGIIKDDLSDWLNRYNKNIHAFVTSAKPEYDSILKGNYGYSKREVILTGLPRYDLLENRPKGKLIIAPTWRKGLTLEVENKSGVRGYAKNFKDSEYFEFYNSIIQDSRITKVLKEKNMSIDFYIHPSHAAQVVDFETSDLVDMKKMPYDYKSAFSEGNLLLTDYSSVAFDFAYLKKPIVYTQFDRETFFGQHTYDEGYFSYDKNGFGPVAYNYEDTVKLIVKAIESNCTMEDIYKKRVDDFFAFDDRNNSKRAYEAILSQDAE